MSFFILLYILEFFLIIGLGFIVYNRLNKTIQSKYFLLSSLIFSIWILLYFLSFTFITNSEVLLYISRFLYSITIPGSYFLVFYLLFNSGKKISSILGYFIYIFFSFLVILSVFTDLVIGNLIFDSTKGYFYEEFGPLYLLFFILYLFLIPLFIFLYFYIGKKARYIEKVRYNFIILGFLFYLISTIFFLVILPTFEIWMFQKEQALFFIPYILLTYYSLYKYHVTNIKVGLGKLFIFILSLFYSTLLVNLFKIYFNNLGYKFHTFWGISKEFGIVDLIVGIILFFIGYNYLSKVFLGNNSIVQFERKIEGLKKYIPYITKLDELNYFLSSNFSKNFKINYINIRGFGEKSDEEVYKYFKKDISRDLFINDIVFIEENKYKFKINLLKKEINNEVYLIFPLRDNNNDLKGVLEIGKKPFKDIFYTEEINILNNFKEYLIGHLKYLKIYSEINDLNKNLDKKIDEKTIELNTLMSAQKDFIRMASHEIKTPLGGAIFQSDIILDEYEKNEINRENMKKELGILNKQLLKVGKLVNNIFDVEKFDIKQVKMFFEEIKIEDFIEDEVERFGKLNPNVSIILDINHKIGYVEIDKVQFTQVIDNILSNSIKYAKVKNLKINISIYNDIEENYIIEIEDNGNSFENIDLSKIFNKYEMGNTSTSGIGMGLYLCKKIVSMHNGFIRAEVGKKLGGANFILKMPKKQPK